MYHFLYVWCWLHVVVYQSICLAERYDDFFGPPSPHTQFLSTDEQYAAEDQEPWNDDWEAIEDEAREEDGKSQSKVRFEEEEEEDGEEEPVEMDMNDEEDEFIGLKRHHREEALNTTTTSTQHLSTYEKQQVALRDQITQLEQQVCHIMLWCVMYDQDVVMGSSCTLMHVSVISYPIISLTPHIIN